MARKFGGWGTPHKSQASPATEFHGIARFSYSDLDQHGCKDTSKIDTKRAKVVIMDCRSARNRLAALSAEQLSVRSLAALQQHLDHCPSCRREWEYFQYTLLVVSTTSQPLLTREDSDRMWQQCRQKLQAQQQTGSHTAPLVDASARRRSGYLAQPPRAGLWSWAALQPRWGWAAVGGALVVLGSVWWFTPEPAAPTPPKGVLVLRSLPAPGQESAETGRLVSFEPPPPLASPLINHHAAMSFDPFTDHVGSTLVSYSATAPQPNR
jgi:hypothetical protein